MSKVKESTELREQALQDAADSIAMRNVQLRSFLLRLLDPHDLGHSVSQEVRDAVQKVLLGAKD
jgi:hypothetical protein